MEGAHEAAADKVHKSLSFKCMSYAAVLAQISMAHTLKEFCLTFAYFDASAKNSSIIPPHTSALHSQRHFVGANYYARQDHQSHV
jgi:hypothetical protein